MSLLWLVARQRQHQNSGNACEDAGLRLEASAGIVHLGRMRLKDSRQIVRKVDKLR
ncbi:MAG: hypothetical protein ACK493_10555 [Planctomycetota bacterium]|nr:hypothetical protein [Blastopirellula sp.]